MTVLVFVLGVSFGVGAHSFWLRRLRRQVDWKLADALRFMPVETREERALAFAWRYDEDESDIGWSR